MILVPITAMLQAYSRVFGLIFHSDRPANIARIKEVGVAAYANEMAAQGRQGFRRGER